MSRPSFHDLTTQQQRQFGNGVGPYWLPNNMRNLITKTASWFFKDASWRHHDFGYAVGGDRWDRARCDWKFFTAMLRDAVSQPVVWSLIAVPAALLISVVLFLAVRIGGQFGSFEYRDSYASLEDVIGGYRT
ncbi:hypothetical protein [Halocynthiibacter namhaensis]|uniref:hypothetical protein n=1 Tax=Halocynthiibacter namhaensis TaxID=1290553 RepID=UPI0005797698|nr:hypothetical protein [Halocynthiibacter namhaensis]